MTTYDKHPFAFFAWIRCVRARALFEARLTEIEYDLYAYNAGRRTS